MKKDNLQINNHTVLDLRKIKAITEYKDGILYYSIDKSCNYCFSKLYFNEIADSVVKTHKNFIKLNNRLINLEFVDKVTLEVNKTDNKYSMIIFFKKSDVVILSCSSYEELGSLKKEFEIKYKQYKQNVKLNNIPNYFMFNNVVR